MTEFDVGGEEERSGREEGGGRREVTSLSPDGLQSLQSGHGQATVHSSPLLSSPHNYNNKQYTAPVSCDRYHSSTWSS